MNRIIVITTQDEEFRRHEYQHVTEFDFLDCGVLRIVHYVDKDHLEFNYVFHPISHIVKVIVGEMS